MIERLQASIPKFTLRAITTAVSLAIAFVYITFTMVIQDGINHFNFDEKFGVFGWIPATPNAVLTVFVIGTAG